MAKKTIITNKAGRPIIWLIVRDNGEVLWSVPVGWPQRAWSGETEDIAEDDPCLDIAFPVTSKP